MGFSSGVFAACCIVLWDDMQIQIKQTVTMDMKNELNEFFGKTGKASSQDIFPIFVVLCLHRKGLNAGLFKWGWSLFFIIIVH